MKAVFKKRPRIERTKSCAERARGLPSKMDPRYWRRRLFKNTYTYKGRLVELSAWSVKIQILGQRKTFSLSPNRTQAAAEACRIYQTIVAHGWEALVSRIAGDGFAPGFTSRSEIGVVQPPAGQWKPRLI